MNTSTIKTTIQRRATLALRPHRPRCLGALLASLLIGALFAPLHTATLNDGFGPLMLVQGERPVPGGCGRPLAAYTC